MWFGLNRRVLYTFLSASIILGGTLAAIQYAKGNYRITRSGFVPESGLLSANSFPPGAEVIINDKLVTATDDTIYLEPGQYKVQIIKDGYSPWTKMLNIEKELVTQTNAQLFPMAPSFTPLTFTGVQNVSPSPDGLKLLYYTASASAQTKNGLYLLDLSSNPLSLQRGARHVAEDLPEWNLDQAEFIWSPDSSEVMMMVGGRQVMLDLNKKNVLTSLPDITFTSKRILSQWEEEMYVREREFLAKFPPEMIEISTRSAKNAYLSPDKKRLLYTATSEVTIPEGITPPVPATNTQPEVRDLKPGHMYVYDREEDKNFEVGMENDTSATTPKLLLATDLFNKDPLTLAASPGAFQRLQATSSALTAQAFNSYHTPLFLPTGVFQWFPDSARLLYTYEQGIRIKEYDGTNDTNLYSGPFADSFVYPWPDGSKLLILTSFSPNTPLNLYAIELK